MQGAVVVSGRPKFSRHMISEVATWKTVENRWLRLCYSSRCSFFAFSWAWSHCSPAPLRVLTASRSSSSIKPRSTPLPEGRLDALRADAVLPHRGLYRRGTPALDRRARRGAARAAVRDRAGGEGRGEPISKSVRPSWANQAVWDVVVYLLDSNPGRMK